MKTSYPGLKRASRIAVIALLSSLSLTGCAALKSLREPTDLADRAQIRWDHLIAGRGEEAYAYLTPGARELTDAVTYKSRLESSQVKWTAAQVQETQCETEEKCTVSVKVNYDLIGGLPGIPELSSYHLVRETWLKLDGKWYFLPRKAAQ